MKNKGFTIIELIVVIVIAGVLLLLAVPAFRGLYNKGQLEVARNEVMGFYQRAHRYATTAGVDYVLQVDETKGVLRCMVDTTSVIVRDSLVLSSRLSIYHGGGGSLSYVLHPDGFVEYGDTLTGFFVSDKNTGDSLKFYISPLGTIEVEKR
ncbi:prepilin-type N-terminal cleavage/methylation domain-containing protein [candidate division WOR-3 bacterium]|nr:prepilin-type N-terminal cleavage/methylation domain-containing protein [candidate division WOR-3 bacterium]